METTCLSSQELTEALLSLTADRHPLLSVTPPPPTTIDAFKLDNIFCVNEVFINELLKRNEKQVLILYPSMYLYLHIHTYKLYIHMSNNICIYIHTYIHMYIRTSPQVQFHAVKLVSRSFMSTVSREGRSVDLAHVFQRRRAIIDAAIVRTMKREKEMSVDNIAIKVGVVLIQYLY